MARARHGTRKDAASAMGIADRTVRYHQAQAFARLGVETWAEAAYALWLRDLWGD